MILAVHVLFLLLLRHSTLSLSLSLLCSEGAVQIKPSLAIAQENIAKLALGANKGDNEPLKFLDKEQKIRLTDAGRARCHEYGV